MSPCEKESITFTQHCVAAEDGRALAVWRLREGGKTNLVPIVLAPGFARRMDHMGPLALYLAHNGFDVYRYDALDHVGLSDGNILDFTMGSSLRSMRTVTDWVRTDRQLHSVGVIAFSLTARVAYELAARTDSIAYVVTAVGVVNLRRTLHAVWGYDLVGTPLQDVPDTVLFERHHVGTRRFEKDAREGGWWTLDSTVAALASARQSVVSFASLRDDWVDAGELHKAFELGNGGPRRIVQLEQSAHDLGRNPTVARLFFQRTTAATRQLAELPALEALIEPSFERLTKQTLFECRIERGAVRQAVAEERTNRSA